jgi:hypothetical protein
MDSFRHAHQRLSQAIRSLASNPNPLTERLDFCYWHHIHDLHEDELPADAQQDLVDLKDELRSWQALPPAERAEAAVGLATAVCDLHSKVSVTRQNG